MGGGSGFCNSKMNFLTVSEDESIHVFICPSASMYEHLLSARGVLDGGYANRNLLQSLGPKSSWLRGETVQA